MQPGLSPTYYSNQPQATYSQPQTSYSQQPGVYSTGPTFAQADYNSFGHQQQAVPRGSSRPSIKKQKIVEVIIEKPVIVHKYVDVPEEIIIEKPVERYIEQDIVIEKVIEVPVERIIETEVEVVREEIREIVVEREVEYERIVEVPVEKYVEVPVEYIREVDVKVPVYMDRVMDRTVLQPIETRVLENPIYMERQVVQDRYVDKYVEVPVDRHVERVQERYINKEYTREVDVVIHVDKVVERPVERIVDVYVDRPVTREVEVPVYVDKYVDRPYEVVVEQIRQIPIDVVRENRVTIAVDKYIDVPVERIVEIPIRQETHVEVIYESVVQTPYFDAAPIDIPHPVYVDKPVNVDNIVEQPIERIVERQIEVPFGRIVERPVYQEINVDVFHITEVPNYVTDKQIDIPVGVEKYVEVPYEEVVERTITIQKIIEKPIVIPRYVDTYVDKVVDVRVEIVVPKIIEVPMTVEHDKVVDLITRVQRVNYLQRAQTVPINTVLKKHCISHQQKARFQESSVQLANVVVENEKFKAELQYLRERSTNSPQLANPLGGIGASVQENDRLKRLVYELEHSLRAKEAERQNLRNRVVDGTGDIEVTTVTDSQDVARMMEHIRRVRAENENLRAVMSRGSFSQSRVQKGSRVVKTDVIREGLVPSKSYGTHTTYAPTTVTHHDNLRPSQRVNNYYQPQGTITRTSGTHATQTLLNSASVAQYGSTTYQQPANVVRASSGYYSRGVSPSPTFEQHNVVYRS